MYSGTSRFRAGAAGVLCLFLLPTVLLIHGCKDNPSTAGGQSGEEPTASLVSVSGCKYETATDPAMRSVVRDCFTVDYSGDGVLSLRHINAALNCCPGTVKADITLTDNTIHIFEEEGEDAGWCRCLCLYDLEYEIRGIDPGVYMIVFEEKYLENGEVLEALVFLTSSNSDMICADRDGYPWTNGTVGGEPYGEMTGYAGCKFFDDHLDYPRFGEPQSCLQYEYNNNGVLFLEHINTAFNCCPVDIYATVVIDDNTITITEAEDPPGGLCDCLCLFDMYFMIRDIDPGEYRIVVIEPNLPLGEEKLEFTVDLVEQPNGGYCVPRAAYPWPAR